MSRGISKSAGVAFFLAAALSGCIFSAVVDVQAPVSSAPQGSAFVKITDIHDLRHFAVNPERPSSPSLGDAADVANPAVTARALGRKRNGYGGGAGDLTLPEGRTVDDVVRDTVRKALQDKGYVLVDKDSPNYAAAAPLEIDVERFWAWMVPEGVVAVYFNAAVVLKGDALISGNGGPIEVQTVKVTPFLTDGAFRDAIERGLVDLAAKMGERLKAPSA